MQILGRIETDHASTAALTQLFPLFAVRETMRTRSRYLYQDRRLYANGRPLEQHTGIVASDT